MSKIVYKTISTAFKNNSAINPVDKNYHSQKATEDLVSSVIIIIMRVVISVVSISLTRVSTLCFIRSAKCTQDTDASQYPRAKTLTVTWGIAPVQSSFLEPQENSP